MIGLIALVSGLAAAGPAPHLGGVGPPPALLRAEAGATWMGFGSYCWRLRDRGLCQDFTDDYAGQPSLPLRSGETVQVDLRFQPTEAQVIVDRGASHALRPGRTLRWTVEGQPRELVFSVFGAAGQGSYVVRAG